jgi:hypothetical protein
MAAISSTCCWSAAFETPTSHACDSIEKPLFSIAHNSSQAKSQEEGAQPSLALVEAVEGVYANDGGVARHEPFLDDDWSTSRYKSRFTEMGVMLRKSCSFIAACRCLALAHTVAVGSHIPWGHSGSLSFNRLGATDKKKKNIVFQALPHSMRRSNATRLNTRSSQALDCTRVAADIRCRC